jgi:hypothetical protein
VRNFEDKDEEDGDDSNNEDVPRDVRNNLGESEDTRIITQLFIHVRLEDPHMSIEKDS